MTMIFLVLFYKLQIIPIYINIVNDFNKILFLYFIVVQNVVHFLCN